MDPHDSPSPSSPDSDAMQRTRGSTGHARHSEPGSAIRTHGRSRLWFLIPVSVVGMILVVLLATPASDRLVGNVAPTFELPRLGVQGSHVSVPIRGSQLTVVNFWASWCVPCRREMAAFEVLYRRHHGQVAVIGVNSSDREAAAMAFLATTGVSYPSGVDTDGQVASDYRLFGMPMTVFISSQGIVLDKVNGELTRDDLSERVDAYLSSSNMSGAPTPTSLLGLANRATRGPLALLVLFAAAFGFGAVHALGPGHGKTMMAAWLAGAEGGARDAIALGVSVAAMHTASALALAALLVRLDRPLEAKWAYLWLSLTVGVAVAIVGVRLVIAALHGGPADHGRNHHHRHPHPDSAYRPLSKKGLVALAAAGGLFPSPSVLLLLVNAIALRRVGVGLLVLLAFSFGLATALSAIGLGLVRARAAAERRQITWLTQAMPVIGGAWLITLGCVVILQSATAL